MSCAPPSGRPLTGSRAWQPAAGGTRWAASFLAWARDHFACVIFNLRTRHDAAGIERSASAFRGLNDAAIRHGGSFYLTYHRWATRRQIEAAYPQFSDFLELKRQYDPQERFTSDWYRHHKAMLA